MKNFEWIGFHKFLRKIVFNCVITNVEPLRIGAGIVLLEPTDIIVAKIKDSSGKEYPYIPGSSIKGTFRSYAVKLMRSLDIKVCDGIPKLTCLKGNEFDKIEKKGGSFEDILNAIVKGDIGRGLCLCCLIFGSPGLSSHTIFYDSYPIDDTWKLSYRYMVALDRKTCAVRAGPFSVEHVEPGAKYKLTIEFNNLPNYAIGVVAQTLIDLDIGLLKFGGFKTRGFGRMKIENIEVRVYKVTNSRLSESKEKEIQALDSIDKNVKIDDDWRQTLMNFANAWSSSVEELRRISNNGWRWVG